MALNWLRPGRSRMLREPPQGRGFRASVRLKTMSRRHLRMTRGSVFQFGPDALGDGGWEESIDKRVGQAADKSSWPKHQPAEHPEDYKYARYKINTSVAVGPWKDAWVTILLAEDADVRNQAFWDVIHEIRKHVTPIRSNRHFPRRSAPRANRYSHKRRRSL